MNVWIISPGKNASIWEDCKYNGYIAIGWDFINARNFSNKNDLNDEFIKNNDETRDGLSSLWYFGKEIKIGDIVVARKGLTTIVGVGRITTKYISPDDTNNPRSNQDFKQVREVVWLSFEEYKLLSGQFTRAYTIVKTDENDSKFKTYIKRILMNEKINMILNLLKNRKQIILQGPPGTGKTRMAKIIARNIIKNSIVEEEPKINDLSEQVKLIQFHPSYSYEDFVRGIVAESKGEKIEYKTEDKVLVDMANKAYATLENNGYYKTDDKEEKKTILEKSDKYILIIDEINRANLSSVLGELIYALEYRDEAVESMYEHPTDGRKIILPSNLYIIGTMNTADRSIGHIDYAIRRRFAFDDVLPDKSEADKNSKFKDVELLFKDINGKRAKTLSPEFEPDRVMLGHSYFIGDKDELEKKLKYQVIPLLREYVSDGVLTDEAISIIDTL
jgi:MoxR-like ATPase